MRHSFRIVLTIGFVLGTSPLWAQTAPPTLQKLTPTGAQRGTQVTVTIHGTNIGDATRLIFSEPGFSSRITSVKEVPVEKMVVPKGVVRTDAPIDDKARKFELTAVVTIAKEVSHGVHGFRLHTPLGVSNQLRFAVSALPETKEQEPNDSGGPQAVILPAALVGSLGKAGDVDAYRFTARAGEEMVFQVVARPLGARLDSVVRLLDASGKVVTENNDIDLNRDSVLTWRFTDAGTYSITIEDLEHGGGADGFGYRIYAGVLAYLTGVFPLGVRGGAAGDVAVTGVNLGADSVRVAGEPAYPGGRTVPVTVGTARGPLLNRKAISLGTYADALEREPNSDMALAQPLAIPSSVNGRIWTESRGTDDGQHPGDQDLFRFTAVKGQKLVFEVTAQQLGSPLDSIVEVLDAQGAHRAARAGPMPGADRDCTQRSRFQSPEHPSPHLERAGYQRLSADWRRAAAGRFASDASRRRPPVEELSGRAVGAARYLAAQSFGGRGGLQGVASRARHAARGERHADLPNRLRE